jgi:hypothetical protein
MIELPEDLWFYLPDTAPVSAPDPQPFPTWARQRPPPGASSAGSGARRSAPASTLNFRRTP